MRRLWYRGLEKGLTIAAVAPLRRKPRGGGAVGLAWWRVQVRVGVDGREGDWPLQAAGRQAAPCSPT